ncbi:hypothetical protein MKW98_022542 [Papaver atlanticum]|uniref:Ninja-family protein n=1 Tax=Papaver atlanticum TaxID=357466 RepID=A0AAD4SKW3_9MAGN|nr:hypothetical protein MKW98_022542 [Papaver atlanticum]
MEDNNGLELSLGLSCGGSASSAKGKECTYSDSKTEEGGSSSKVNVDLRNFINAGCANKQDLVDDSLKDSPALYGMQTSEDNFFSILKSSHAAESSVDLEGTKVPQITKYRALWDADNSRSLAEDKSESIESGAGNKRKMSIEEVNKKHEREILQAEHSKNLSMGVSTSTKNSHVSISTDDGSAAENDDAVESEARSSSRLISHVEDGKRYKPSGNSYEVSKESHAFHSSVVRGNHEVQRESIGQFGNESNHGVTMNFGIPMSFTPATNIPFSVSGNVLNAHATTKTSAYPVGTTQMTHPANNERPRTQPANPGSTSGTLGYSTVQLPILDTGHSWGVASHPQQFPPSYVGRNFASGDLNSNKSVDGLKISQVANQALPHSSLSENSPESVLLKGNGKQQAREDSSVEHHRHEGSIIKSGMAPGLKFGGCGSYPDLPWVSTTGPSPNGRTISGVTYKYDKNQMRIVCACHGTHMSPEEFVLHASSSDKPNPDNNAGLASFPNNSPAASAKS